VKIHAAFTVPHYWDHLEAIWKHLPDEIRGSKIQSVHVRRHSNPDDLVLIAGFGDLKLADDRRVVFVEHGAGQRYVDLDERRQQYYGGPYPDNVIAYLGPRQSCVDSVGLPGFAICAPVCDPYELMGEERVCAITWHWRARRVCPEADTALPHYIEHLGAIVERLRVNGWEVLGHRHPRLRTAMTMWENLDVDEVSVTEVRERAELLISDNTSLAYEMAYLGRRNIVLNAPWYRRDVEHGLRFWSNPAGPMMDDADELLDAIDGYDTLTFPMVSAYERWMSDGDDGLRAATWLSTFAAGL